jgi:hypothetical protein
MSNQQLSTEPGQLQANNFAEANGPPQILYSGPANRRESGAININLSHNYHERDNASIRGFRSRYPAFTEPHRPREVAINVRVQYSGPFNHQRQCEP